MGRACSTNVVKRNTYRLLVGTSKMKETTKRTRNLGG
jgi:hypothetical protein